MARRLGGGRDSREVAADLVLREATELLAVDDHADLDGLRLELLFARLLEGLEPEADRLVLAHAVLVPLLEHLHDRVPARPDTPRLVRDERAARVRLVEVDAEIVHARHEERSPERPDTPVLRVVLFVVAVRGCP